MLELLYQSCCENFDSAKIKTQQRNVNILCCFFVDIERMFKQSKKMGSFSTSLLCKPTLMWSGSDPMGSLSTLLLCKPTLNVKWKVIPWDHFPLHFYANPLLMWSGKWSHKKKMGSFSTSHFCKPTLNVKWKVIP